MGRERTETTGPPRPSDGGPAPGGTGITIEDLWADYGAEPVLRGIGLEVSAGEVVALLGPSGCGKTTLLRSIAGLERPTRGRIALGDRVVTAGRGVPPEARGVGMVFQDGALFPHLPVGENVAYGLPRAQRRGPKVAELLELVGLASYADRLPGMLSGGQQQRVALARALARDPGVMLLDEPFSSLDAGLRARLRSEVRRVLKAVGITTVLVTHDQHEALGFGDRAAVMRDGRIEQFGPPAELYGSPATPWLAGFVGEANLLAGRARGGWAATPIGRVAVSPAQSGDVVVLCRPEQLQLQADPTGAGLVEEAAYSGQETRTLVRLAGGDAVSVSAYGTPRHRPGDRVAVAFTGARAQAWPAPAGSAAGVTAPGGSAPGDTSPARGGSAPGDTSPGDTSPGDSAAVDAVSA